MTIKILRAQEKDAGIISAVKVSAFKEEVELYGEGPPDYDDINHQIQSINESYYYKIMDEDKIIGGMGVRDKGDWHYWLCSVYIDLEYQNKGIGKMAMKYLEKEFPDAKKWSLETPYLSFRNQHFYERLGFIKVGQTEPDESKNGFHLFLYEKVIQDSKDRTKVEVKQIGFDEIKKYSNIPITYEIKSEYVFTEVNAGLGGFELTESNLSEAYLKNYDDFNGGPNEWSKRFDVTNWQLIVSQTFNGDYLGGAAVAFDTQGCNMLCGRNDMAVLWDLRVFPEYRGKGVGRSLFLEVVQWAKEKKCKLLKIETQNTNVGACKFYAKMGCKLGAIDRYAYMHNDKIANEICMMWYLDL